MHAHAYTLAYIHTRTSTHMHTHARTHTWTTDHKGVHNHYATSRLTVVSRVAKQSRARDTTVFYIHERSILIERSPKASCKTLPYEKITRVTKIPCIH